MAKKKEKPYVRPDFDSMTDEELMADVEATIADRKRQMEEQKWEPEEIERRIPLWRNGLFCRARKISTCCRAPYDMSRVIQSGPHKGHGHYLCSICKKSQFQV